MLLQEVKKKQPLVTSHKRSSMRHEHGMHSMFTCLGLERSLVDRLQYVGKNQNVELLLSNNTAVYECPEMILEEIKKN
jgi:hypothetical protein